LAHPIKMKSFDWAKYQSLQAMTQQLLFLFLFLLVFKTQQQQNTTTTEATCYVSKNNFLKIHMQPNSLTRMELALCGQNSYSSLVFSTTTNLQNMTFGLIFFRTSLLEKPKMFKLKNHFQVEPFETVDEYTYSSTDKTYFYWNMNKISIALNHTWKFEHIIFACHTNPRILFQLNTEFFFSIFKD
jgi:hypothetical protein